MSELSEFKKELLEKYDVNIGWECDSCSDLQGICDEKIVFATNSSPWKTLFYVDGDTVSSRDL